MHSDKHHPPMTNLSTTQSTKHVPREQQPSAQQPASGTTAAFPRTLTNQSQNSNPDIDPSSRLFKAFSFTDHGRDYALRPSGMLPPKIRSSGEQPGATDMLVAARKPSEQLDPFVPPPQQLQPPPVLNPQQQNSASSDPGSTENSRSSSFFKRFPSIGLITDFNDDLWKRSSTGSNNDFNNIDMLDFIGTYNQRQRTPSIFFPTGFNQQQQQHLQQQQQQQQQQFAQPGSLHQQQLQQQQQQLHHNHLNNGNNNNNGVYSNIHNHHHSNSSGSAGGKLQSPPSLRKSSSIGLSLNLTPTMTSSMPSSDNHQVATPQIPVVSWMGADNLEQPEVDVPGVGGNDFKRQRSHNDETNKPKKKKVKLSNMAGHDLDMDISNANSDDTPVVGATKVDQLMLLINARKNGIAGDITHNKEGSVIIDNSLIPDTTELVGGVEKTSSKGAKNHQCKICGKLFTQSNHLEVHVRSHMGLKPFKCEFCEKRFTQGGNLRTHMRLHTGERPFECSKCSKSFSRKGNLQAHLLTHEEKKPFVCKFDNCYKSFTQLGNMKSHQNRFHMDTLNKIAEKLANGIDNLPPEELEMVEYFSDLYKNLNKGIKGRGKSKNVEHVD